MKSAGRSICAQQFAHPRAHLRPWPAEVEAHRAADDLIQRLAAGSAPRRASGRSSARGEAGRGCGRAGAAAGLATEADPRPPSRGSRPRDDARQRALAGAGLAHDRDGVAAPHVETHAVDHAARALDSSATTSCNVQQRRVAARRLGAVAMAREPLGDQAARVGLARRLQNLIGGADPPPSCRGAGP